jgi:hypothetical protein
MFAFQQRVVDELCDLQDKISALSAFMTSAIWLTLSEAERARLCRQHSVMVEYASILRERIEAF